MLRRPIRRGGIVSAGYDPDRRWLDIEFDTHRVMRYEDVGPETADRFLTSASPRSYFADEIEDQYTAYEVNSKAARDACPAPRKKGVPDELKRLAFLGGFRQRYLAVPARIASLCALI